MATVGRCSALSSGSPPAVSMADAHTKLGEEPPRRRVRRRRRCAAQWPAAPSPSRSSFGGAPIPPRLESVDVAAQASAAEGHPRPMCILERSTSIERPEADLRRALLITVGGNRPAVLPEQVLEEVAAEFDVAVEDMSIIAAAPKDFLLILPDLRSANTVYNDGQPVHSPNFSLHFKRWTRLALARAAALPDLVDIELHGVPAHAWELATAQHLLRGVCWVCSLHPETAARRDLTSFRLTAWCLRRDLVPSAVDLFIPEPPVQENELPPLKRGLAYPIDVIACMSPLPPLEEPPAPPSPPDEDGDRRRRRHRCRSPSPVLPASSYAAGRGGQPSLAPRRPVHSTLGPYPTAGRRVLH